MLHEDQLITPAERKLARKTHLPGGYLKKAAGQNVLGRKHQLLERVVGDTPLLSAFLREVFSVVHSHALSSCMGGEHARTSIPFIPRGKINQYIMTQFNLNSFHMLQFNIEF